ncbi:MAG TPA: DEAD/DEAH box helicase family protein, partial [Candidatus Obscuribacterales bacterium]
MQSLPSPEFTSANLPADLPSDMPGVADPALDPLELAVRFHPYQRTAIDALLQRYAAGERRLHLVAPPGAGKTLIGLELLRRIGHKGVVLSPTLTIARQWTDKANQLFVRLDQLAGLEPDAWIAGSDPDAQPALLALSYQRISVKGESGLHNRVTELFERLAQRGYRTLLLDECHHLLAHWAQAISAFLAQLPDAVVIGLTATPPQDRSGSDLARYLGLVGEVDHEILAPAVIREGHLAPFQDLAYLVRPTEAETQYVSQAHFELQRLLEQAEDPPPGRPALSLWAESWLLDPRDRGGEPIDQTFLLQAMPDRAIALMRYLGQRGLYPPDLPWCAEMDDPPELADLAELLGAWGQDQLAGSDAQAWAAVRQVLGHLGYAWQRGRFVSRQGEIDRVLALSAAKLRATAEILQRELACLGGQLRALVLTDFETTHAPGGRAARQGLLDPDAGGALAVMRLLCASEVLRELNPLMVTGQTLLCAPALLAAIQAAAAGYFAENGLTARLSPEPSGNFYRLFGSGPGWNSSVALALVTQVFSEGLSRCLIGTRGLLGEGWDCPALNTLIDLTAVSSFVAVNQIRGRSLRQDPQQPLKLANNWDVVALLPELAAGYRDLDRFVRKHAHYFGLCDDGRLEQGVGHVHPLFEQSDRHLLLNHLESLNAEMLEQAGRRAEAYDAWQVGQPYRNQQLSSLQLRLPPAVPAGTRAPERNPAPPLTLPAIRQGQATALSLALQRRTRALVLGQSLSLAPALLLLSQPLLLVLWLGLSQTLAWQRWHQGRQGLARLLDGTAPDPARQLRPLGTALLESFQAEGLIRAALCPDAICLSQRQDGHLRLHLQGSDPAESALYIQAMQELLEPLQEQRYLLSLPQSSLSLSPGLLTR